METDVFQSEEELNLRKLEAFFHQTDCYKKEVALRTNFEGLTLRLYTDIEEVYFRPTNIVAHLLRFMTPRNTFYFLW